MKLAFDTGGTFTDFAMSDDDGTILLHKVLSTPDAPARAVTIVAAVRPTSWLVRVILFLDGVAGILVVLAAGRSAMAARAT